MAQRGGVVESTLLLGGYLSPTISPGEADVLLGFELLETLRALPMSLRGIIGAIGLAVALPFLAYLVYLSQAKTTSSDQVIFLAFAFSITFPTLILLSLVLFRSLVILAVSLPIYAACVIAGYARTFMSLDLIEQFQALTGAAILEGYGLTEASPITHLNPLEGRRKPGSIGIPMDGEGKHRPASRLAFHKDVTIQ